MMKGDGISRVFIANFDPERGDPHLLAGVLPIGVPSAEVVLL
jgi:hypothetical protein